MYQKVTYYNFLSMQINEFSLKTQNFKSISCVLWSEHTWTATPNAGVKTLVQIVFGAQSYCYEFWILLHLTWLYITCLLIKTSFFPGTLFCVKSHRNNFTFESSGVEKPRLLLGDGMTWLCAMVACYILLFYFLFAPSFFFFFFSHRS